MLVPTRLIDKKSVENTESELKKGGIETDGLIVYQHPIDAVNEKFRIYCNNNKDSIKKSKILISLPISYVEQNNNSFLDSINTFIKSLNDLGFDLEEKIKLIPNVEINKALQTRISESFVQTNEPDIYLTFFKISELIERSSLYKSRIEIILGLVAVPLGVIVFYLGIVKYSTPPAFGSSLLMIGGGPILFYIGLKNRKYQKWLKND